ncbi:MAG TPA: glycoside hydrolase family 20 protein [Prolixibacteraceae bacterium]|jgi:hexosaminidase
MKQTLISLLILAFAFVLWSCKPNKSFTENELSLIPQPQHMTLGSSSFKFNKGTQLVTESVDQKLIASQFAELLEKPTGWKLDIVVGGDEGSNQVYFTTEPMMAPEAYSLEVSQKRIEIKAAKPAGFFYAIQTLRQLLPPEIESAQKQDKIDWLVPVISITDQPAFKWRGFMLDVARHFFPKEDVLRMIDNLALHKINTLHLHLVDDQGWRIEIKKYPKLTEIGAWRVDREDKHWNSRTKQQAGEKATYGGFYTQEDIKEMVAYAQSRFITIVPEIEMPAHVTSALAAYPSLSCTGGPFTVLPGGIWPITDIYCAGKDSTFLFLEDVLTEVIALFPSKYIHIGGDEATKTEWEKCPDCKNRIKAEGLKNVGELQSYFIKRIEKFIHSKGRVMIGWDEILEGGLPEEATVMSWRGFNGGVEAANLGHDVVMTPNSHCYFDYYQGPASQEPPGIGGYLPLSKVYGFNPVPPELGAEAAKHILGGQANLWSEYVPTIQHAQYMAFPRMAALAETLWSPVELRNWEGFSRRIQLFMKRYAQAGINYAKSAYKVTASTEVHPDQNNLAVTLKSELNGVEIRYTLDESKPTTFSRVYSEPVVIDQTTTLKAVTIVNGQPAEKAMSRTFNINKATTRPVTYLVPYSEYYKGSGDYTLVNGVRASTDHTDGEWQGWVGTNMEVVVALQQPTEIHSITVGSLQNPGALIFSPKKMEYFVSSDGIKFDPVAEVINEADSIPGDTQVKNFTASFGPVKASFVKVIARKGPLVGKQPTWIFTDEIVVE